MIRFAAIGDSFTEGLGDDNPGFPHGIRGWADRVAKHLGRSDPDCEYINLGIRARRFDRIVSEQLRPALAFRPTVVSFFAGANDLLDAGTDITRVLRDYRSAVDRLRDTGATVLLFTCFEVKVSRVLEVFRSRLDQYNVTVAGWAELDRVIVVDHHAMTAYHDPRLWSADRMHMSPLGHKLMAATVLDTLGVPRRFEWDELDAYAELGRAARWAADRRFVRDHVVPLVGRKLRGVTLGDDLGPKWPEPVRPADGLRKLQARRRKHAFRAVP